MQALTGIRPLVRLILRRDRVLLPLWVIFFALFPVLLVNAYVDLFPTAEARQAFFDGPARSPALVGMMGPAFSPELGSLVAQRAGIPYVLLALVTMLTVIRHTRTEEEAGRRDLVGAAVVGRHAPLAAALAVAGAANLVIGAFTFAGSVALGLPVAGSVAFALATTSMGWMFAAAAAVAAQLTPSAGGARGIAFGLLGSAFLLRAIGDTGGPALAWASWLSPIGWAERLRPFAGEQWWVLALVVGWTAAAIWAAIRLSSRRDVGAGILPARTGRESAAAGFARSTALAFRLHRGLLLGWIGGFAVFGLVIGGAAQAAGESLAGTPQGELLAAGLGTDDLAEVFIIAEFGFMAVLAAGYAVQAALRARREEDAGRAEPVLATAVGRVEWAASHVRMAALGPMLALAIGGTLAGLFYGLSVGDVGGQLPRLFVAAMVQLPAVWLVGSIAVALFGVAPRWSALSWGFLAFFLVVGWFGVLFGFEGWVLDLSPFAHTPNVLVEGASLAPLATMLAIAGALVTVGLVGFRGRDLA